ncbi:MAG: hypothetical protein ABIS50_21775 [Luteolibacter sp.]|uniref:hypothetical protein n=1 Tax=Luteolibacter sp. TaxID=1962973 RepID=UPI003265DCE5
MMRSHSILSALVFAAFCSTASAGIVFGPVRGKAGESVRLVTHSDTAGGTISKTVAGKTSTGTILITRDRDLVWTFRDPAADGTRRGMVKVDKISTSTKTVIDGHTENLDDKSPLVGKMFAMSKSLKGDWKFELDGSVPMVRVQKEIDELKIYLNRDWYPAREVNLGESWEFDPAWIKMIVERDFPKAQTIGTMRLRQIRHTLFGKSALIEVSIRSTGAGFHSDGSEDGGSVELTGQIVVNLQTMLDESLELKGTITTDTRKRGDTTSTKVPVHLVARKSFVRNPAFP